MNSWIVCIELLALHNVSVVHVCRWQPRHASDVYLIEGPQCIETIGSKPSRPNYGMFLKSFFALWIIQNEALPSCNKFLCLLEYWLTVLFSIFTGAWWKFLLTIWRCWNGSTKSFKWLEMKLFTYIIYIEAPIMAGLKFQHWL